jgi:hypothetical protein
LEEVFSVEFASRLLDARLSEVAIRQTSFSGVVDVEAEESLLLEAVA